jgi:hypothetical protein
MRLHAHANRGGILATYRGNMTDKPTEQSGKPNKFNQQNQSTEERKAVDNPRQAEPVIEPTTETQKDKQITEDKK